MNFGQIGQQFEQYRIVRGRCHKVFNIVVRDELLWRFAVYADSYQFRARAAAAVAQMCGNYLGTFPAGFADYGRNLA